MVFLPTKGHLIPIGQTGLAYNYLSLLISRPNSNRIHIGIAKNNCEKISGGVRSMPKIKNNKIRQGREFASVDFLAIPALTIKYVAIGISNAIPNAKINLITKFKYCEISVITTTESGAMPMKKVKIIGQTIK